MRNIKIFPLILILSLLLALPALASEEEIAAPPTLESAAAIVLDNSNGRVLYELNADVKREPASLTKVMTALLAAEAADNGRVSLDDSVTAGSEALEGMIPEGSTANIQPGETMTLRDLLYCAMLGSANEACNIIAVHIAGSIEAFVKDMNERAAELGCTGTHFANTHGLPDGDHYTTARDFALICREAMANDTFYSLAGTVTYTVPATNMAGARQLSNTNGLINPESQLYPGYYYEHAVAGKTGHTNAAGYCLASMAENEGVGLICVVLGGQYISDASGNRYTNFSDSRALYDWVYNNFSLQEVLSATEIVTSVKVELAEDGGSAALRPSGAMSALLPNKGFDPETLEPDIVIFSERDGETLTAPIAAGSVVGEITLSLDGVELGRCELVTNSTVELARSEFMKREIAGFFGNIWVIIIVVVLIAAVTLYVLSVVRYRKLHKRHLQSVAEAAERAAERRSGSFSAVESDEPTTVRQSPAARASHPTGELEKTTVLAGDRSAAPRGAAPSHDARSSVPPKQDDARRDYFEEFFRKNGRGPEGK